MSTLIVNRVTNANVLFDGKSMLGRAEEIDLPDVKFTTAEHKALGMQGRLELPTGIDKLEASFKWNSFYIDVMAQIPNPYNFVSLQVRSSVETWDATGRTAQAARVIHLKGGFKEFNSGKYKQHDNAQFPSKMNVIYLKDVVDGRELYEIDVMANIYKVDGVDLMAQFRSNLGI